MPIVSTTNTYSTTNPDGTLDSKSITITANALDHQLVHLKIVRDNETIECLLTNGDIQSLSSVLSTVGNSFAYKPVPAHATPAAK